MKKIVLLVFGLLLFFGCCGLFVNSEKQGNVTVTESGKYEFTYSADYLSEGSELEKFSIMAESGNYGIEKLFFSKKNHDTVFLVQTFEGQHSCEDLNAKTLDYAKMDSSYEDINGKQWCIGKGYKSKPSESSTVGVFNCKDKFVVLFFTNADYDNSKGDQVFYSIMKSFKCL